MTERPYKSSRAEELERIAEENENELAVLFDLAVELFHRRMPRSLRLRGKVVGRVTDLLQQGFEWPTTDAPGGSGGLEIDSPAEGLLKFLGYRVGRHGLREKERRAILDNVYLDELLPVNSSEYMAEWGRPRTGARLEKLSESLAANARNKKRSRTRDYSAAIRDWEADLAYLRAAYYVGHYDFVWPKT